ISARSRNADRVHVSARNRRRFHHVQRFPCRRPVQNIRQHDVGEFHVRDSLRRRRTHETATNHRHFFSTHPLCPLLCELCASVAKFFSYFAAAMPFIFSIIAPAKADVPSFVAPGRRRSRS